MRSFMPLSRPFSRSNHASGAKSKEPAGSRGSRRSSTNLRTDFVAPGSPSVERRSGRATNLAHSPSRPAPGPQLEVFSDAPQSHSSRHFRPVEHPAFAATDTATPVALRVEARGLDGLARPKILHRAGRDDDRHPAPRARCLTKAEWAKRGVEIDELPTKQQ